MPDAKYFGRMGGAIALGLLTMAIAFLIFVFLLPYLIPFVQAMVPVAFVIAMLVIIFLVIWAILYVALFIGVAIYYVFRPMKVSKEDKSYSISKSSESGRRQKGRTRKK